MLHCSRHATLRCKLSFNIHDHASIVHLFSLMTRWQVELQLESRRCLLVVHATIYNAGHGLQCTVQIFDLLTKGK